MANLAKPINVLPPAVERIIEFKGLNKKSIIEDGEMPDMWNLTADKYPVLSPRKPRGEMGLPSDIMRPIHLIRRFDKLGIIAIDDESNVSFYYDGVKIDEVTGLTAASNAVAINNRMCFFPDKTCIDITRNGVQPGTFRSLEADITLTAKTVTISNVDARITLSAGHGLRYDDAINIHITSYTPSGGSATATSFDVSCIIEEVLPDTPSADIDTIVLPRETFIEMTGEGVSSFTITGTAKRTMPDLDYVVEWNNRLWGCSNADNTIYACKLGDPFNWNYYQGTSMDSYYAEQGTDESFTGIAEYSGHLIFFKPNSMARVYGSAPSNYQITNTKAFGVEEGSSKSIQTINDTVFYKSSIGIMAYQGGTPFCISDKWNRKVKRVVSGTEGLKYYASCLIEEPNGDEGRLLVYDIAKGMWHKEDALRFTDCCKAGDQIIYTTATAEVLTCGTTVFCDRDLMVSTDLIEGTAGIINPDTYMDDSDYEGIEWMAQFGPFDEYIEEHKIYSKLALRMRAVGESQIKVYISIDEGDWELVDERTVSTMGDFIPIVPRRCDRYSIKIEGQGNCEIKSLTRRVRRGSFGRL